MTLSYDTSGCTPMLFYGNRRPAMPDPIHLPNTDCSIRPRVPLGNLTTFRVGGPAEWYVVPRDLEQAIESLHWARGRELPITLLGAGSNLLISDRGIPGLVLSTRYLRRAEFEEDGKIVVGAGEPIVRIAWKAAKRGWTGFEWAVGIPGSIGGCVVMNAGAHGRCMADVLESVVVLEPDGSVAELTPEELGYSYRTSKLQGDNRLVLQATLRLQPGSTRAEVMAETNQNLHQRKSTQPYHLPSCGSVFRNHDTHKAGWLIEQLGLKGYQIGGAQIAHRHANFILNCGGAKANDIFQLIRYVQEQVELHWSLSLHPEVKFLGEF